MLGRDRELANLMGLLAQPGRRIVTLTGPGGSGKTRLAIQAALDLSECFPVWFVPLAAIRDADLVLPTVARAVGVRETGPRSLEARLGSFFSAEPSLLVLDNVEQVLGAAPLIARLAAASHDLKILVTSRSVLHITGEHDINIRPLDQTASVALFAERAAAANGVFSLTEQNTATVSQVCERLDGLPLAIELAAAQSRLLSPAALLTRLDRRLAVLTGGPCDQPARLQTMRAAIAWSYELLSPEQQCLFQRAAVFADGFSPEGLAAVGGDAPDVALRAAEELLDRSLLVQEPERDGEPRFRMLETIREFGLEQLRNSPEAETVCAAHAVYYLKLAEEAETRLIRAGSAGWVERLGVERANLRAAVNWGLDRGDAEAVLRLSGTLLSDAYARGHPGEGLRWLEAALAQRVRVPPVVQVDALFAASALAQVQGDFERSIALSRDGLAIARGSDYRFGEARVHIGLGISAEWQGDLHLAVRHYRDADHLMRSIEHEDRMPHWTVLPTANLADVALLQGDTARAVAFGEAAVSRWREAGYLWGIAQALGTVAAATSERGDQVRAARLYRETLDTWLSCFDGRGLSGTIAGIAALAIARGEPSRAALLLGAARGLADRLGVRFVAHHVYAERVLARAKERIAAEPFAAQWSAGMAMSIDDAIGAARELLDSAEREPQSRAGLSPRELDVLRLVAAGQTDREIADLLSIGVRTVETHVGHILDKLGASGRTEAAAIAVRRQLA
jgi:non-specific serine/threonine protein kinase